MSSPTSIGLFMGCYQSPKNGMRSTINHSIDKYGLHPLISLLLKLAILFDANVLQGKDKLLKFLDKFKRLVESNLIF